VPTRRSLDAVIAARFLRRAIAQDSEVRHALVSAGPTIPDDMLVGCRVFSSRKALIGALVPRGGLGIEVGTQTGEFARFLLDVTKPSALHVVDVTYRLFDESLFHADDPLVRHEGLSWEVLRGFADASMDWIYIDASHAYNDVTRDIRAAATKVRSGGLLVFNDYTSWSPIEVVPYGVLRAVNELLCAGGWDVVGLGLHGLGYHDICLRRR